MNNNNQGILVIIAVLLIGILGVVYMQYHKNQNRSPGEKIADSVSEAVEELGDEIDDHTSN